jgi:hypothetical protein
MLLPTVGDMGLLYPLLIRPLSTLRDRVVWVEAEKGAFLLALQEMAARTI